MQLENMSTAELIALVKLQEAALGAEQARYESLSKALASIPAKTAMADTVAIPLVSDAELLVAQAVRQPAPVADERAAYEAWMRKEYAEDAYSALAWAGWQARAALAAPVAAPVVGQEPFGMYVERDDGTTEFQRTGKAFQGTAQGYKAWALFTAPVPVQVPAEEAEAVFTEFCEREGYPSDGEMDDALRKAFFLGSTLGYPIAPVSAASVDKVAFHNDGSEPDWTEHAAAEARDAVPAASVQPETPTQMALRLLKTDAAFRDAILSDVMAQQPDSGRDAALAQIIDHIANTWPLKKIRA